MSVGSDYGLWGLVVLNSLIFVGFAYSFFKPLNLRDWRSFGAYSASSWPCSPRCTASR